MEGIVDKVVTLGGYAGADQLNGPAELRRAQRAAQAGKLVRLKRGVYATPSSLMTNMIDVERMVPGGVVCMWNAWLHHGLSTAVPPAFCLAVSAKRKVVTGHALPIQLFYWKPENLEFGITSAEISGHKVRITSLERSVCDCVKYRNKVGLDVCAEVLKNYLRKPERNLSLLNDYAHRLHVAQPIQNYLEIVLA